MTADTSRLTSADESSGGGSMPLIVNALAACILLCSVSYVLFVFFWKSKHEGTSRQPRGGSLTPLENNVVITKVAERAAEP
ncbi:unnamed protein product, partial [Dibothriocephalus latus]